MDPARADGGSGDGSNGSKGGVEWGLRIWLDRRMKDPFPFEICREGDTSGSKLTHGTSKRQQASAMHPCHL